MSVPCPALPVLPYVACALPWVSFCQHTTGGIVMARGSRKPVANSPFAALRQNKREEDVGRMNQELATPTRQVSNERQGGIL